MAYGDNILSTVPADWFVTNGTLTSSLMGLHEQGSALLNITTVMLEALPATAEVTIITTAYGTSLNDRVDIIAILPSGECVSHALPIVDVGNGIYRTTITFPEGDFSELIFRVSSIEGIDITEWSMRVPIAADYSEVIDGVKQEIPKLLWDYNTTDFVVKQEESTVGMISARLHKNGDLQGHILINFTASVNSVVVVRIFDNEIQELYSPIEYDVVRGRNSISIPHAYLKRKIGTHNFLVTMQIMDGSMTVETRGVLYTIDGGYLATRILDVGYELYDITIKQLPTDNDPSEIFAVCIDDNKALIRKRILNEEVAIAWDPVYTIDEAIAAKIEFSGLWKLRTGEVGFTLETQELPYVIWIDQYFNLWAQHGPDLTTQVLLDTEVSTMSVCFGYNYAPDVQFDQGMICAYIKSGKVMYRTLCRVDLNGTERWNATRELTAFGTGNSKVMVNRLNDYRVAINAINTKSQWLISDRGYVGQAIQPEHNRVMVRADVQPITYTAIGDLYTFIPGEAYGIEVIGPEVSVDMCYYSAANATPRPPLTIQSATILNPTTVQIELSHSVVLYETYEDYIKLYSAMRPFNVTNVAHSGNVLTFTLLESIRDVENLDIDILATPYIRYIVSPTCIYRVDTVASIKLTSPLLSFTENPIAAVVGGSVSMEYMEKVRMEATFPTESNVVSVTNATVTCVYTLVGNAPI